MIVLTHFGRRNKTRAKSCIICDLVTHGEEGLVYTLGENDEDDFMVSRVLMPNMYTTEGMDVDLS
jgi:hypothetical protein